MSDPIADMNRELDRQFRLLEMIDRKAPASLAAITKYWPDLALAIQAVRAYLEQHDKEAV